MKTHSLLTAAVLLVLSILLVPPARAQTNAANFFQSSELYLTTFTTNGVWTNTTLEVAIGADYQSSVQWANDLEVQYDINHGNWGIGYRMRNAGIAGVVEMDQAKVEYSIVSYLDTRVEASLYAGYDNQFTCAVIEPELDIRKKLTANTFAGVYISEPFRIKRSGIPNQWVPNIGIETGFTF